MDESKALVTSPTVLPASIFTEERIAVLKSMIMPGASQPELELFMYVCKRTGLDPFTRQIYPIRRWDEKTRTETYRAETSIDGFRLIAERTATYAGQQGPWWCGEDGKWVDVWLSKKPPAAARVGVLRDGFKEPLFAVARWETYARTKKSGELMNTWAKMPDLMLAKVAEALALRRAFPRDLSGLYTSEEMGVADKEAEKLEEKPRLSSTKGVPADVKEVQEVLQGDVIWDGVHLYRLSVPPEFLKDYRFTYFRQSKNHGKHLKDVGVEDLYQVLVWANEQKRKGMLDWQAAECVSHVQEYLVSIGELDPTNRVLPLLPENAV